MVTVMTAEGAVAVAVAEEVVASEAEVAEVAVAAVAAVAAMAAVA